MTKPVVKAVIKSDSRDAILQDVLKSINKKHGTNTAIVLGEEKPAPVARTSSGSLLLDSILGGGYPKGRIIEIYGPESSGKTTMVLHAIAEVQKAGGIAAFIDAENALSLEYAQSLGVDIKRLIFSQPDSGEQALDVAEELIKSGIVNFVAIDSVAALVPQAELDGEMGDSNIGLQARLMSKALRKISGVVNKTSCTVMFVNQLREKIGIMFGSPETTTGGKALKFYASVRLDVRKKDTIKDGSEVLGHKLAIKTVKNKVFPPLKSVEVDIIYGKGVDAVGEIVDMAVEDGIIVKAGAWFAYKNEKIGQGRENTKNWLKDNPEAFNEISNVIKSKIAAVGATAEVDTSEDGKEFNEDEDNE